jgi:phage regulator Rha-like protein
MAKQKQNTVKFIPDETIIRKIYTIRGQKVMLDFDLAALYKVETKALNQAVKRNIDKFPWDFMFRLTTKEWILMRSQIVTSSTEDAHLQLIRNMKSQSATSLKSNIDPQIVTVSQIKRKTTAIPYAFTEHGIAMLANILKSERAVKMSIAIVRAFISLKKAILQYTEITEQLQALKQHLGEHDHQLNQIYDAIENLLDEKAEIKTWENRERIGFKK